MPLGSMRMQSPGPARRANSSMSSELGTRLRSNSGIGGGDWETEDEVRRLLVLVPAGAAGSTGCGGTISSM